jgi:dynein light intermediate chain 1
MLSPLDTSLSASTSAGTKEKAKRSPEAERNARAEVLRDTAVLVVLDWTKPGRMMEDLVGALNWLDAFGKEMGGERIADEQRAKRASYSPTAGRRRDRCAADMRRSAFFISPSVQAFIQHYTEPAGPATPSASNASPTKPSAALPALPPTPSRFAHASNEVLPLGSGTLTHNPYGIPLFLVCTKSDQIDLVAEELGFTAGGGAALGGQGKAGKGGWEERTDWVGCVLRTVGLMC